jgi:chemotaxis response regulator CheB
MEPGVKALIRVLVVDDSPLMCKILTNIMNCDPEILVAAVASNGKEAVELVPCLKPDIITMDMEMPVMDGFEATKQIMASHPTPILIVASTVLKTAMDKEFIPLRGADFLGEPFSFRSPITSHDSVFPFFSYGQRRLYSE